MGATMPFHGGAQPGDERSGWDGAARGGGGAQPGDARSGRGDARPARGEERGEADGALRPRRAGQLEPRRVRQARERLDQRRTLPAADGTPSRGRSRILRGAAAAGVVAGPRAGRDAVSALEEDVERDRGEEGADEEREQEDGVGVQPIRCEL